MQSFRIVVFGESEVTKGKGRRARTKKQGFGYILWNADESTAQQEGRPGFGSFAWYGIGLARRAALDALIQPGITQVAVKTQQDKDVFRFYRCHLDRYVGQANLFMEAA